nr:hypothetical protein [Tanacetum cinerariifolium]
MSYGMERIRRIDVCVSVFTGYGVLTLFPLWSLISLVTPFRSAVVVPSSQNQGRSSATPAAEGSNPRDSQGKGIMADDVVASSVGVNRSRPSFGPVPSFRDVSGDAIHTKLFPFSAGPYYPTYPKADSRLKGYAEKVAILTGSELQVSTLKKQVSRLNDKLSSFNASFSKSKAKGKERKKKIKSLTKSLDNLHAEVARLSADLKVQGKLFSLAASVGFEHGLSLLKPPLVAQTGYTFLNKIFKHATDPLLVILQLEPEKLACPTNVSTLRDAHVSPSIAKESTMTPASKSLELSTNVAPNSSIVALEKNKEWVNAIVDGPDAEMNDGAAHSKSGGVFVQGTSHVLDDVAEVTVVGSECVSSSLTDVVVALSAGDKGDGSLPSSIVDEEATTNPSRV